MRATIHPVGQVISQVNQSLGNVERDFDSLTQKLTAVSRAKGSLQELDRDLAAPTRSLAI